VEVVLMAEGKAMLVPDAHHAAISCSGTHLADRLRWFPILVRRHGTVWAPSPLSRAFHASRAWREV